MTLNAIADGRRMNLTLDIGGFFVCVAGETQAVRCSGDKLYAGNIFINANFMATLQPVESPNGLPCPLLILVALDAFGAIHIFGKRNRMLGRKYSRPYITKNRGPV